MAKFEKLVAVDVDAVLAAPGDSGGAALIAAPGVGKRIRVHAYALTLSAAAVAKFRDTAAGAGTSLRSVRASAAGQGQAENLPRPDCLFEVGENLPVFLNVSAPATITGGVTYAVVPTTEP